VFDVVGIGSWVLARRIATAGIVVRVPKRGEVVICRMSRTRPRSQIRIAEGAIQIYATYSIDFI